MGISVSPVKILIVDDDEDDFFITSEYIRNIDGQDFVIDWCVNYEDALNTISNDDYHLYFVDYMLGAKTGLELIEEAVKTNCESPFILLTGLGNKELDLKAMQSGAVDYLVKGDLTTEKLERCIRYSLERSASLSALRANERKFRNIFERSKDTVFIADEQLFFKEVNDTASLLFEYSKEELLQQSLYSLLANNTDRVTVKNELATSDDVADKEIEMLTKQGEKKSCILTLSKEKDRDGKTYIQGIIHDITTLKKAERTTLQVEKLGVTSRLVRILAHEVRNPLNNINLSVEQLETEVDKEETKLYLDIIGRNSRRIGSLISELLNSSRPAEMTPDRKSLQKILDESLAAAIDRITLKHIKLKVNYPPQPVWIMADGEKLKIAFLNIIINAVEAMEDSKGELTISILIDNATCTVLIRDNGTGIDEENLSHLFEPYFTSKRNGMGLGLASTLNILQSHKATVDVQSSVNQGSVFRILFNIAEPVMAV
ncbi:MAG: ATP-binding protein [Ferruginibacter sp.]